MLRTKDDLESSYYVRLEPGRNRIVFDAWPRAGDMPFMVELERPLRLVPGKKYEIKLFVDGTICEVYAGGKVAMSARMYTLKESGWGVFVSEGSAKFSELRISPPP